MYIYKKTGKTYGNCNMTMNMKLKTERDFLQNNIFLLILMKSRIYKGEWRGYEFENLEMEKKYHLIRLIILKTNQTKCYKNGTDSVKDLPLGGIDDAIARHPRSSTHEQP
jgi:hypothetical protein